MKSFIFELPLWMKLKNDHRDDHSSVRFHIAVRLFSNRSQITSKCGKNKSVTRGDSRVCHWCCYHILTSSVIYYWTDARQHGIYLFYIITKQIITHKAFVYFKILQHNAKAGLCPAFAHFGRDETIPFDVIYDLYKMRQFHCLLWIAKNCDRSRKITSLSNLTQAWLNVSWNENLQRKLT